MWFSDKHKGFVTAWQAKDYDVDYEFWHFIFNFK